MASYVFLTICFSSSIPAKPTWDVGVDVASLTNLSLLMESSLRNDSAVFRRLLLVCMPGCRAAALSLWEVGALLQTPDGRQRSSQAPTTMQLHAQKRQK